MNKDTERASLEFTIGEESTCYYVQVEFTHGLEKGETPYKRLHIVGEALTYDEAKEDLKGWRKEGYIARIVKITTIAEALDDN